LLKALQSQRFRDDRTDGNEYFSKTCFVPLFVVSPDTGGAIDNFMHVIFLKIFWHRVFKADPWEIYSPTTPPCLFDVDVLVSVFLHPLQLKGLLKTFTVQDFMFWLYLMPSAVWRIETEKKRLSKT